MASTLLADIRNQNSATCPASWDNIADFSVTGKTVQGTNSVVILMFSLQLNPAADNGAEFRFTVNGTPVGPVLTAFSDNATNEEANSITMVYAVDGLSGSSNSFAVQWQDTQGSPVHDTSRYRTFQVLEIQGGDAEIIVDMEASNQIGDPVSWADLFTSGSVSVAGTGSILMMIGNVAYNMEADEVTDFRFEVDSTPEANGPESSVFTDEANGGNGWSGVHVLDGLSAGTHTFHLAWQAVTGNGQTRAVNRTFQVVEITANATLQLELYATDQQSAPGSYGNVPDLSSSYTVDATDAIHLIFANIQNGPDSSDSTCDYVVGVDGVNVGADLISFSDSAVTKQRMLLAFCETGLSAVSHSFQARWKAIAGGPVISSSHTRTLYAIEFTQAPATPKGFSDSGSGSDVFVRIGYELQGVTYDKDEVILGSVKCFLYKDNLDNTITFVDYVLSNAVTGAYTFPAIVDNDSQYFVVFIKDGSPNVFDVTDHVLTPVAE